jgi:hypothetical protein
MKFKKKFKEKTKLTQVNLTNPLHTKWDWDKKIIYIYFFIKEIEKKNKVKSIKKIERKNLSLPGLTWPTRTQDNSM